MSQRSFLINLAALLSVMPSLAQTTSRKAVPVAKLFEDDEVRIIIPAGWQRAKGNYPSLGNSAVPSPGTLVLQRDGYTLALAYRTTHASGIMGGRFLEAFHIPWLQSEIASDCSSHLAVTPQPASRTLLFQNLVFNTADVKTRAACGIPKPIAEWVGENADRRIIGVGRWYAGLFTTRGGWFFDEDGGGECESKLYSLTSSAKTPAQLPAIEDPYLAQIIREAIDIVDSI